MYSRGDYQGAINTYSRLIEEVSSSDEPDLHIYYSNRCQCYIKLGKHREALSDAESCTALKPGWFKGHTRKGACLHALGRYADASYAYERAADLDPQNVEIQKACDASLRAAGRSPRFNNGESSGFHGFQGFEGFSMGGQSISSIFSYIVAQLMMMSDTTKIVIGCICAYLIYRVYRWMFVPTYYDDIYHDDGYSSYSYQPQYGLSWTTWIAIIAAAYYIPPYLQPVLGYQYARPFFGMNFTTFVWLLQMFTNNQRFGGGFNRGGFGGRRRNYY